METLQKQVKKNQEHVDENSSSENAELFKLPMQDLSNVTLVLPISGLIICFITGYIFQNDEIHETHCRVSFKAFLNSPLFVCCLFLEFYLNFVSVKIFLCIMLSF